MNANALIQKWDQTIASVHNRFGQILTEAVQGSTPLIAQIGTDFSPLIHPWGAVEHQKHQHTDQISDAWDEISDELSDIDDLPDEIMDREGNKRDYALCDLEIQYMRAYRHVMAQAADVMRQRALTGDAGAHKCQHCGALLDRLRVVGQARNVECGYCDSVNTIDPGPALRMFAAVGALWLGEMQALAAWEAMSRAETQIQQYRNKKDVPMPLLQEFASASHYYHQTRFTVEAEFVPEQQQYVPQKVESYMKAAHKLLRAHPQWRAANGG